jgi:hypothetical protein
MAQFEGPGKTIIKSMPGPKVAGLVFHQILKNVMKKRFSEMPLIASAKYLACIAIAGHRFKPVNINGACTFGP